MRTPSGHASFVTSCIHKNGTYALLDVQRGALQESSHQFMGVPRQRVGPERKEARNGFGFSIHSALNSPLSDLQLLTLCLYCCKNGTNM